MRTVALNTHSNLYHEGWEAGNYNSHTSSSWTSGQRSILLTVMVQRQQSAGIACFLIQGPSAVTGVTFQFLTETVGFQGVQVGLECSVSNALSGFFNNVSAFKPEF